MTTGQKIYECRKRAGMTQEELAGRLNVSRQAVSKWEADAAFPETEKILALCRLFSLSADELLFGNEPHGQSPSAAASDSAGDAPECAPAAYAPPRNRKNVSTQKVLGYAGGGLAMLGALISFIFVFLIGFGTGGDLSASANGLQLDMQGRSLFYYFNDAYREVEQILSSLNGYPGYCPTALYLTAVCGTITATVALLAAVALFSVTVVRYIRNLTGKTDKRPEEPAFASFFAFLMSALLLLSVERIQINIHAPETAASLGIVLNGTTIAGICIGGVCMAGALGCAIARGGREHGPGEAVMRYVFCAVSLALSTAVCALFACGCVQLIPIPGSADFNTSGVCSLGFPAALFMAGMKSSAFEISLPERWNVDYSAVMGLALIGFALTLALAVLAVLLLTNLCIRMAEGRKKTFRLTLAFTLTAVFASAAAMLLASTLATILNGYVSPRSTAAGFATAIVIAVIAVILLVLNIVHASIERKTQTAPAQSHASQPMPAKTAPAYTPPAQNYVPQPMPAYAPPAQSYVPQPTPAYAPTRRRDPEALRRTLLIIENVCFFLGALVAFVFTFLIGFTIRGGIPNESGLPTAPGSLFYYFGGAYSDATWLIGLQEERYSWYAPIALYGSAIFGTIAAAATIFAVTFFFVRTLKRMIVNLRCRTGTGPSDALVTFLCFLAGVLLLCSVTGLSSTVTWTRDQITIMAASARTALNGATIAGICLGAGFLAVGFVCALLRTGINCGRREMLVRTGAGIVKTGLCLALLILFAMPILHMTNFNAQAAEKRTIGFSLGSVLQTAGVWAIQSYGTSYIPFISRQENFFQIFGISVASYLLLIALTVLTILLIKRTSKGLLGQTRRTFGLLLAVVLLSLVEGFLFLGNISLIDTIWVDPGYYAGQFGSLITAFVLALVLLAAGIAERIVLRRIRRNDPENAPPIKEEQ